MDCYKIIMSQTNQQEAPSKHVHALLLVSTRKNRQQRATRIRGACKLVLLLISLAPLVLARSVPSINGQPAGEAVLVTLESPQPVVLQSMMNTSVTHLVFQIPHFELVPEAWTYITEQTPFMLMRNFTITSDVNPQTVIDYRYLARRVALGDSTTTVTFKFKNVTLMNVRKSSNFGIDWFTKSPGAMVLLDSVVVVDTVCSASPADALTAADAAPTLPGYPPNSASIAPMTCVQLLDGQRCFNNSLHYDSFAAKDTKGGGYTFVLRNSTRVCIAYVDPQCLKQHDLEYCWAQKAQEVQPMQQQSSPVQLSAGAAAGIAIAGVVVLVVAGVLCWWWFWLRERRRQQHQAQHQDGSKDTFTYASEVYTLDSTPSVTRSIYSSGIPETVVQHSRQSMSGNVQLGILLGAGSFGRVYRGRWHNSDVAIKVINCNARELPKVLQEAEVMMKLDHEFIVRALHCMVVHKAHQRASGTMTYGGEGQHCSSQPRSSIGNSHQSCDAAASPRNHTAAVNTARRSNSGGSRQQQQHQPQPPACRNSSSGSMAGLILRRTSSAGDGVLSAFKTLISSSSKGSRSSNVNSTAGQQGIPGDSCASSNTANTGTAGSADHGSHVPGYCKVAQPGQSQQTPVQVAASGTNEVALPPSDTADLTMGTGTGAGRLSAFQDVEVWLVMELCSGGTLKENCSKPRDTLAMAKLVTRLLEVAQGMAYLHAHNCIHGDLKAANVMLKSTIYASFGQVSKISDFGLAFTLMDGATHRSTQTTGTISHSAPEVLSTGRLSPAADVYAFGIMMWELFTACSAFQHLHYGNVVQRVLAGERPPMPEEAPDEYQLLMTHCWAADPKARPTFEQVAECLELLLDHLQGLTTQLQDSGESSEKEAVQQDAPDTAAAFTAAKAQMDAALPACITPDLHSAAQPASAAPLSAPLQQRQLQQQQQQAAQNQGSASSASGSGSRKARGLVSESRHVQDL